MQPELSALPADPVQQTADLSANFTFHSVPEALPVAGVKRRRVKKTKDNDEAPTIAKKAKLIRNPRPPNNSLGKKKERLEKATPRRRPNRTQTRTTLDSSTVEDTSELAAAGNQGPQVC